MTPTELLLSALPDARRSADNSAAPSAEDVAYYRRELDRIRRMAILRRELGEPDRLLEAGVSILERRLVEMEASLMIDTAAEIAARNIPVELTLTDQWVLWKTVIRNGKPTKVPYQADGVEAASNNPESWGLFPDVLERYGAGGFDGIGFMFGAGRSGFVGIDLDGCRDPETGIVQPWAKEIIERLDTYSEVSPSRTGVKLFLRGRSPFETGKNLKLKNVPAIGGKTAGIEIYDRLRYFAVTGWRLNGPATCEERQAELDWLKGKYWGDVLPIQNGDFYGEDSVLERARKYLAKCPPAIEGQNGVPRLFTLLVSWCLVSACRVNRCLCYFGSGTRFASRLGMRRNSPTRSTTRPSNLGRGTICGMWHRKTGKRSMCRRIASRRRTAGPKCRRLNSRGSLPPSCPTMTKR